MYQQSDTATIITHKPNSHQQTTGYTRSLFELGAFLMLCHLPAPLAKLLHHQLLLHIYLIPGCNIVLPFAHPANQGNNFI